MGMSLGSFYNLSKPYLGLGPLFHMLLGKNALNLKLSENKLL